MNSCSKQPKAQRSDWPLYSFFRKNSGGEYSRVPKKVVEDALDPSFWVCTLDDDTDEDEEPSSAIDLAPLGQCLGGLMDSPKSQSFVYPSALINTFSGFRLNRVKN